MHTVAAFLRINYIPRDVIAEMMRQNKFVAFQAEGTFKLLSQIIMSRLQSLDLILDKLWLRLDETHQKASISRYCSIIALVHDYLKLMPNTQEKAVALMQRYLDAYSECIVEEGGSFQGRQIQELLNTIQVVAQFHQLTDNNLSANKLHSTQFFDRSTDLILNDIQQVEPAQLIKMVKLFPSGSSQRSRFLSRSLSLLQSSNYDMSRFTFPLLVSYIGFVAEADVENLLVFQDYLDRAVSLRQYTEQELSDNFDSFTELVHLYALNGCLKEDQTMMKYMMILSDKIQLPNE